MAGPLPSGWEERFDVMTGYVDTKNGKTTWDDPRLNPQLAYSSPPMSPSIGAAHPSYPEAQPSTFPSIHAVPSCPWVPSVSMPTPPVTNMPDPFHTAFNHNPTRPPIIHQNSLPMPTSNPVVSPPFKHHTMPLGPHHTTTATSDQKYQDYSRDFSGKAGKAVEATLKFGINTGKKFISSAKKNGNPTPFQTSFPTTHQPVSNGANGYIIPQDEIISTGPPQAVDYFGHVDNK
ncbi:8636_t:CDS:2 [Ambispora gerdemannii]|uniref:8636_t:CDS:1 n=1 Tax=Ambispora gerdemannii TaxID=144530 RepID=A0A9N9B3R1_9GLOM|nr:8636_t:CDS:2 [Ambispora gerdemannii]